MSVRSIKHYYSTTNSGKLVILREFIDQYRIGCQFYIDYVFSHSFNNFDINQDILNNPPKYIDYQVYNNETKLSARALSSAMTQALSIVRGSVAIRRKLLYIIQKRKEDNLSIDYYEKKLLKYPVIKPILKDNFSPEISSKLIDFSYNSSYFDGFIRIKSTGFQHIKIPFHYSKADKKWLNKNGKQLNSILLNKNFISLRYDVTMPELKKFGKTVGADTGFKSTVTLSDNQYSKPDNHGHTLESICRKLSRKKRGSKNFLQAQQHRENYINWSINQLNLNNIKQINLEKVDNIFYKHRTSKLMSRWTNSLIENKLLRKAEEQGVLVNMQPSLYRSQRCSECGLVLKSNRNGKIYKCRSCGIEIDSDLNAAKNHEVELFDIPFNLRSLKLNIKGFFWKEAGIFSLDGREIESPIQVKIKES